ncbi:MAG: YdcF family protein [Erysipelotrichaceae bacterium]|jgi:uncharacterized SAM-binding protein YcdF (DUF218 family)|nr:YdcF family protein [Erysipelotrichaceae bacterium]
MKKFFLTLSAFLTILLGGSLIGYTLFQMSISILNLGTYLPAALGILLLLALGYRRSKTAKLGFPRFIKVVLHLGLVFFLLTFSFFLYNINSFEKADEKEVDAIIVLGAGLNGTSPSWTLAKRLDRALAYYKEHPDTIIVVTGGQGPDEVLPESQAMANYLLKRGVSSKSIYQDDTSLSTQQNLSNAKKILDKELGNSYTTALVTDYFHCWRALQLAKTVGLDAIALPVSSVWYMVPSYYLREYVIFYKDLLLGTFRQ